MSNFVIQSIKRSVLYFFIITITIFTFMTFGIDIFDLTVHCEGPDESNTQESQSNSSTQNTQSVPRDNSSVPSQQSPDTSSTQGTQSSSSQVGSLGQIVNSVKEISSNLVQAVENYVPYGAGTSVGAATMRYSGGSMPQIIIASAASAGITVLATGIAGVGVKSLNNARLSHEERVRLEEIARLEENKKLYKNDSSGGSGNSADSNFTANSPLDSGEMENPLLDILDLLIEFNVLELLFILLIMYIILNVILKNKLGILLGKYVPSKFKKIHFIINKVHNSGKIDNIFIFVLLSMLLIVKFTGLYFIHEIKLHIDDLVWLYNQTKK